MKNIATILIFLGGFASGVLATNVWFWITENRVTIEAVFFGVAIFIAIALAALASQRNNRGGRL